MGRILTLSILSIFSFGITAQYLPEVDLATLAELNKNQKEIKVNFGFSSEKRLPDNYSLKKYSVVSDQTNSSSCTGFAVANGAMTILYNMVNGITMWNEQHVNRFDPFYVYCSLKDPNDLDCISNGGCNCGSYIHEALDLIENYGCKKAFLYPKLTCSSTLNKANLRAMIDQTGAYSIDGWFNMVEYIETKSGYKTKIKIKDLKEVITMGNPIIAGINVGDDFRDLSSSSSKYSAPEHIEGGHAVTIIGYDDNKYGGAFHVLNSYGSDWGDDGYFWMSYDDFKNHADGAFVIYKENWDDWRESISSDKFYKGGSTTSETMTWEGPVNSEGFFHGMGIVDEEGFSAIAQYENGVAHGWWMIMEDFDVPDPWGGWALFENGEIIETEDFGFSSSTIKNLEEVKKELHIEALEMELNSIPATEDDLSREILDSITSKRSMK